MRTIKTYSKRAPFYNAFIKHWTEASVTLVYTPTMTRVAWMICGLSLMMPSIAVAQVIVSVPSRHYKAHEKINAKVENRTDNAVTFCVEVGQTSSNNGEIESTPLPFSVERNSNGKWGTLMIGPDVGGVRGAIVTEAGESKEFPFRLNDSGRMRLRLNYWRGSIPTLPAKGCAGGNIGRFHNRLAR